MTPGLFADRFLRARDGHIDLATGDGVSIRRFSFSDYAARDGWLAQAPLLLGVRHQGRATLIDFGVAGPGEYFEAWSGGPGPRVLPVARRPDDWSPEAQRLSACLEDVLDGGVSGRPRAVRLPLPAGAATTAVITVLARCARLRGYVPVSARLPGAGPPGWQSVLEGRHILLLQLEGEAPRAVNALLFLSLGLTNDRPHVWLTLSSTPQPLPGVGAERGTVRAMRVREESAPYSTGAVIAPWTPGVVTGPSYHEFEPHRGAVGAAAGCRHAALERTLREAEGRAARRHDLAAAGEAALALGRLLLFRGRIGEASRAFTAAHGHFDAGRLGSRAVSAGVFSGLALTDAGRFCDAESALRAALVAAESTRDDPVRHFAALALARCLLWQGRHDEVLDCLDAVRLPVLGTAPVADDRTAPERQQLRAIVSARERRFGVPVGPREGSWGGEWPGRGIETCTPAVIHACLLARAAMAAGELAAAGRPTADARARARHTGSAADVAAACRVRAQLFAALGDVAAVRGQVEEGLQAARRAHDPLRALRLRIVLAEALTRDGRRGEAAPLISRLSRLDPRRLPVVVRHPLEQLLRQRAENARTTSVVAFPADATRGAASAGIRGALAAAVIEVLGICQGVEDEREALRKVLGVLRGRLRAASIACLAADAGPPCLVSHEGNSHVADSIGQRSVESGIVIPPSSSQTGLEAAVPIRFGGSIIGVFACRWAADVPPDWPQAGALLAAASAAVAPCLRSLLDRRVTPAADTAAPGEILGVGEAVRQLRAEIARAAAAPFNVVIEGESGSGKELVARAIHRLGPRAPRPLCALNCAALTDELVEAELFGHARGAFTGAVNERKGLFEEAHLGTLVLDEVGELTPRAQAKLLRVIQEGEVRRLGENTSRKVDVRIVAATNRPLRAAVEGRAFRPDLLYRLEVIRIAVPPLRARVEDIPVLAAHFWAEATGRLGSRSTLSPATLAALARYEWPGNVRELQNVMAALAVGAGRRGSIGPERLPAVIARQAAGSDARNLDEARRLFESAFVRAALARAGGRRAQAAADLGLTRQGLAKLMARLGIG